MLVWPSNCNLVYLYSAFMVTLSLPTIHTY